MRTIVVMSAILFAAPAITGVNDALADPPAAPLTLLDAVRTTLRLHPAIQTAAAELRQRTAEVDVARGPFDPTVTTTLGHNHDVLPVLPQESLAGENSLVTDTTDLSLGAAMTTTWGTSISPNVGFSRVHHRAGDGVILTGVMNDPSQRMHAGLSVVQPLLRGAGTVGAASAIEAARLARDAAEFTAERTAEAQAYLTLLAYFEVVADTKDLALLRAAEDVAKKVLEDTKALVEGQQRPRSDLPGLQGNLANRTRAVIEAENDRLQAAHQLALAMGLGAEGAGDFQVVDDLPAALTPTPDLDTIVRVASRDRRDLVAARKTVASAAAALQGAEKNTLPGLNLSMSIGYAGASADDGLAPFFAAAGTNVRGVDGGVALSLELPVSNTARIADRDVKVALTEQARIQARDLERQLPVNVTSALDDLRLSRSALDASREAVKQFEQAVADQRDKLHEGVGTVIDLVLTEELLISAEQRQTANHLRCADALARVFFEMGALPSREGAAASTLSRLLAPAGAGAAANAGGAHAGQ